MKTQSERESEMQVLTATPGRWVTPWIREFTVTSDEVGVIGVYVAECAADAVLEALEDVA